ncbi:MAG: serine--tRNA ligase [Candidatus Rokubacteria bacterium]|nr:serine--tRNA ligase [Candidatus Rokubacteria bacterium]
MLDLKFIREHPDEVARALETRGGNELVQRLLFVDSMRRKRVTAVEAKKAFRNTVTQEIAQAKRGGETPTEKIARMRELSDEIKEEDTKISEADKEIESILLELPNLSHPSVPVGGEEANQEMRRWGTPRQFAFDPKPHWEIGERLGILDFERAARLAKSRFAVLWGVGARLERALIQFMLDLHTREHGYQEVWVPHLVNAETMLSTGQLPKFEEQLFKTQEPDENRTLYLIPTAEVPVTCLHGGEILKEQELPKRYVAFTPCYRREAGTYGQDTRGMMRHHQFDKVELVKVTTPGASYEELESMVSDAEEVLKRLGLPYRVVVLASGDLGFAAAKTYDLEVWLPGQGRYREISSCSNCEAFQARRAEIRYRPAGGGKAAYCHTLNGSGLAVGRTLIAVLENYQEADGSVTVPPTLRPYMDGLERITAP